MSRPSEPTRPLEAPTPWSWLLRDRSSLVIGSHPEKVIGELANKKRLAHSEFPVPAIGRGIDDTLEALGRNHDRAIGIEHHRVARGDRYTTDVHRNVDRTTMELRRRGGVDISGPHRKSELSKLVDVSHGSVDKNPCDTVSLGLCSQ